jgi:hypothetical protein
MLRLSRDPSSQRSLIREPVGSRVECTTAQCVGIRYPVPILRDIALMPVTRFSCLYLCNAERQYSKEKVHLLYVVAKVFVCVNGILIHTASDNDHFVCLLQPRAPDSYSTINQSLSFRRGAVI